jgi:hypothetical protein
LAAGCHLKLATRIDTEHFNPQAPALRPGHRAAAFILLTRAWNLKEAFDYIWRYKSVIWAGVFLGYWCGMAMRSRLAPMKKVVRMLRKHEELLLNWFRAYDAMEIAWYHTLGRLPEPVSPHEFC